MKILFALLLALPACSAAETPAEEKAPSYVSEAPLPKGWPEPGPYNEVAEKEYPKYRAAVTEGSSGLSFWTLFGHIKKKDIPMTAPVEMKMEEKDGDMEKVNMAFLYQNTEVGKTGDDGKKVKVKDIGKSKALSYAWMGNDSRDQIKQARKALEKSLKERGLKAESFRLLGYNGPGTPRKKRTYELQAILPAE